MTPLEKCVQPLQFLIARGDIQGIGLAEKAIDEFMAGHNGPDRQAGALNDLTVRLVAETKNAAGQSVLFAEAVFDYIDKRLRALAENP